VPPWLPAPLDLDATENHYKCVNCFATIFGIVANGTTSERIAQTRRRLEDACTKTTNWFKRFNLHDQYHQYRTHLETLESQIAFLLGKIDNELDVIDLAGRPMTVYANCRLLERRLLWVWRLFAYFQSKYDQRMDPDCKQMLAAADEIMWSCYMQPFRWAGVEKFPPHPLPFLTNAYSPYAIPREEPPAELRSDVDAAFLKEIADEPNKAVGGELPTLDTIMKKHANRSPRGRHEPELTLAEILG